MQRGRRTRKHGHWHELCRPPRHGVTDDARCRPRPRAARRRACRADHVRPVAAHALALSGPPQARCPRLIACAAPDAPHNEAPRAQPRSLSCAVSSVLARPGRGAWWALSICREDDADADAEHRDVRLETGSGGRGTRDADYRRRRRQRRRRICALHTPTKSKAKARARGDASKSRRNLRMRTGSHDAGAGINAASRRTGV